MDLSTKKATLPFFCILILFIGISILNIPVLQTLWRHSFDDGTYSHAYLIPFISLYLYYQLSIDGELHFRKNISFPFMFLSATSCYLLFITTNAQISIGYWFSFLLVCISSILMLFRCNLRVIFPAAFLVFILPFWGVLVPLLQDLSVIAVTFIMSFTSIPTYVEAQTITIPAGVFEIAGGCSGLRYLLVSLSVSTMFIFLYINNIKNAAIFFVIAILGALITNWIRITLLIIIGEYTDMQSSLMTDHNMFGWYLYIPFMFLLFKWGELLSSNEFPLNKDNSRYDNKINSKLLIYTVGVLTMSSTSIKALLPSSIITMKNKQLTEIKTPPHILFYSSIEYITPREQHNKSNYRVYHFNQNDLDSKSTFFGNQLIPDGWAVQSKYLEGNWQTYTIYQGTQYAKLKISYEIDDEMFALPMQFKIQRLKTGLTSRSKSKLHWNFQLCDKKCEDIKNYY
jgi:exosortase A